MRRLQADLLKRLTDYQTQKRLSQKMLAKQLGVAPLTMAQWLEGHRKLRPKECDRLETFLNQRNA